MTGVSVWESGEVVTYFYSFQNEQPVSSILLGCIPTFCWFVFYLPGIFPFLLSVSCLLMSQHYCHQPGFVKWGKFLHIITSLVLTDLGSFISCMYFGVRFASFLYLDPTEFRLNFQLGNLRIMTYLGGFPIPWRCDLDEVSILMLFMLNKDGGIGRLPWRKQVGAI